MTRVASNFKDLTGMVFGSLVVTASLPNATRGRAVWQCVCNLCGRSIKCFSGNLLTGKSRTCGCTRKLRGKDNKSWRGYEGLSGWFWHRNQGRGSKFENNLPIEYGWELFVAQQGTCALSGLPIEVPRNHTERHKATASLDRIDSTRGYEVGNVQWVHKDINRMKNSYDQDYFISMCKAIAAYNTVCEV